MKANDVSDFDGKEVQWRTIFLNLLWQYVFQILILFYVILRCTHAVECISFQFTSERVVCFNVIYFSTIYSNYCRQLLKIQLKYEVTHKTIHST